MATLYGGSLRSHTPLVFTIGFLCLFTFGGLTGVVLSNASLDIAFHDTVFINLLGKFIPSIFSMNIKRFYINKFNFRNNHNIVTQQSCEAGKDLTFIQGFAASHLTKDNYNEYIKMI